MQDTAMKTSLAGILEICEHEGIVLAPYFDVAGVMTFGVGHTASAGDPDPAKMSRAMPQTAADKDEALMLALEVLQKDLEKFERRVNDAITVPLKQHEFDALVSFDFNTGGIYRAKLTTAINTREENASEHFLGWLKPAAVTKRRMAEKRLFETGDYNGNGTRVAVWGTDGNGTLQDVIDILEGADLAALYATTEDAPRQQARDPQPVGTTDTHVSVPSHVYHQVKAYFFLQGVLVDYFLHSTVNEDDQ